MGEWVSYQRKDSCYQQSREKQIQMSTFCTNRNKTFFFLLLIICYPSLFLLFMICYLFQFFTHNLSFFFFFFSHNLFSLSFSFTCIICYLSHCLLLLFHKDTVYHYLFFFSLVKLLPCIFVNVIKFVMQKYWNIMFVTEKHWPTFPPNCPVYQSASFVLGISKTKGPCPGWSWER